MGGRCPRGLSGGARGALAALVLLGIAVCMPRAVTAATPDQVPHLPGAPVCGGSPADPAQPTAGRSQGADGPDYFASDFPRFTDSLYPTRTVGGFGGIRRGAVLRHTPVIFVHGNQADAQNWLDVMLQFQNDAHYTMQEMYALSYNGLGNYYGGSPVQHSPTTLDQAYITQNAAVLANGGHGSADDDETPQLCRFVEAVQWYTGSAKVDIVSHSLGVTITRRFMQLYPALAKDIVAVVGIAGANHGTTVCRGLDTSYYGCNEIAPGTAWLTSLDGPNGNLEAPAPTDWMTVYDGLGVDPFYSHPSDHDSPMLKGAVNRTFPGQYHNDLRVGPAEVDAYLPFLLRHGQAGPDASATAAVDASAIEASSPDGTRGRTLCDVPRLTGAVAGCPAVPDAAGTGGSSANSGGAVVAGAPTIPDTASPLAGGLGPALAGVTLILGGAVGRRRTR
jgi:hypothetical protein